MKNQDLFSSKDKSEKNKKLSAAIFIWHFKDNKNLLLYVELISFLLCFPRKYGVYPHTKSLNCQIRIP